MKSGYLSQYFSGVVSKKLSAVEVNNFISNQHEFNGTSEMKKVFGSARKKFKAKFIYITDDDDDPVIEDGFLTWYDARERHPIRSEYRMYFPDTCVSFCAAEGDILIIGMQHDKNSVIVIVAEGESTIASQLLWLFGFGSTDHPGFSVRGELESEQDRIGFASSLILEQIGIRVNMIEETYLEEMLKRFDGNFPSTEVFSEYARSKVQDVSAIEDPDNTLLAWVEREEILFRTLERNMLGERLSRGFGKGNNVDVDDFLTLSLSVQNRRKSRAGRSLENHLEEIFKVNQIRYVREGVTENRKKPDFLFPSIEKYRDIGFNAELLTMLGVKTTCKDRWRQVLSEADRISEKHLLTLEAAISISQTEEMKSGHLQLIVPRRLHGTYKENQKEWIIDLAGFINIVKEKQLD